MKSTLVPAAYALWTGENQDTPNLLCTESQHQVTYMINIFFVMLNGSKHLIKDAIISIFVFTKDKIMSQASPN